MIYNKIKELRESKKITIEVMAFELEINVSVYANIENGTVDLKLSKVLRIAELLDVSVLDLFETTELKFKDASFYKQCPTSEKKALSDISCAELFILNLNAENQKLNQETI
jgi:transcriptional regulator with XRE-family HTH domain